MHKAALALAILCFCGIAFADQKTEADLRARLAISEAARLQAAKDAAKDKAALAASVERLANQGAVTAAASHAGATSANQTKAQTSADVNAAGAQTIAEENGDIARQAAARALEAAAAAQAQAQELQKANARSNEALLITQIFGFLAILVGFLYKGWTEARDHRWANEDVARRDVLVAVHQKSVEDNLKTIKQTGDDTHTLVNNNMSIQLRLNATSARALADQTRKPADLKLAAEADEALENHLAKQAIVDKTITAREKADGKDPDEAPIPQ